MPTTPSTTSELTLPAGWNARRDLVILVGRGWDAVARELVRIGQERLVLLVPKDAEAPDVPAPVVVARRAVDVLQAIMGASGELPNQLTLRASSDPWVRPDMLEELAGRVRECIFSKRLMKQNVDQIARLSLVQGLRNLGDVARRPSIDGLDEAFAGRPAVLVSPGPSLAKNIDLLRELKGRALLVTGTHALSSFAHAGVAPDLVLAADPGDLGRHCEGFDMTSIEALLVAIGCQSSNFAWPAPRILTFAGNAQIDDWVYEPLREDARLGTGGSVACSALSLAIRLGCDPVILVGQDLSFPGGRYYAEHSLDGSARVELADGRFQLKKSLEHADDGVCHIDGDEGHFTVARPVVEVAGYHGGTVPSSDAFRAYLFWFEAIIDALDGEREVWNCTEGGARIRGAEQLPLADALARLRASAPDDSETLSPGAVLDAALAAFDPAPRAERLSAHFAGVLQQLDACLDLARRCKAAIPAARKNERGLARFEKLERKLRDAVAPLTCIPVVAQKEIGEAVAAAAEAQSLEANLAAARKLFEAFENAATFVRAPLVGALGNLGTS